MKNINTTTAEFNMLKELIEKKSPLQYVTSLYDEPELVDLLKKLRKVNYRVFLGEYNFEQALVTKQEYIKQMGYSTSINTNSNTLQILALSDLHLGSIYDTPWFLDAVFNLCKERNIKYIVDLGDLTEGEGYIEDGCRSKEYFKFDRTVESELNYLNMNVPYDKDIKHILLYGNHDLYSPDAVSKDISKLMKEIFGRKDLIVCGIEDAILPVNNDSIHLFHHSFPDIVKPYLNKLETENPSENQIILAGHSHISRNDSGAGYDIECIPTLSRVDHHLDGFEFFTGFVILNIEFNELGQFKDVYVERYRFDSRYTKPTCFHVHHVEVTRLRKK